VVVRLCEDCSCVCVVYYSIVLFRWVIWGYLMKGLAVMFDMLANLVYFVAFSFILLM
jgi:hypothetical protein